MIKKIIKKIVSKIMKRRGYSAYFAPKVVIETISDFKNTKNVSFKQKMWAYRRGFFSSNISRYRLTEESFKNYMPNFDYYKLHPINGRFSHWIDDKMTMKYILRPFNEYLPEYYFEIHKGKILKLMDCPSHFSSDIQGIIDLLESEGNLALKLISGSKGVGFYKISFKNNSFYINDEETIRQEMDKFLRSLNGYMITEYIIAHPDIRKVYPVTPNALRVGVFNDGDTKVFGAFIRYGSKKTGMIDNASAGGIFCGVDIEDGILFSPKRYQGSKIVDSPTHPDTGVTIEGRIPHWGLINKIIKEIGNYIPQMKYMGYDIIITEKGFKIIEINSHQALTHMQPFYPMLENKDLNKFFESIKK